MASITFDGQSFMVDGRRVWLVSGSICYARVPREHWADRIAAAKHAGLNCVETPVIWARHEPRQGQFDFAGQNDIRHFVTLIGRAGMHCILRPGPYVGTGWNLGGLPSWLASVPNVRFRTANAPFLDACSRYITALSVQVRDLQVTSAGEGGPIILIQNESAWTCGHDALAAGYLGELSRYFRESGFTVPVVNSNNLWQGVEGEIDCWTGYEDMLAHMRQLAAVRPNQPRMVIDFRAGESHAWGYPLERTRTPEGVVSRLGQCLAAGAQFNISPFHGGTNFGFSGGKLAGVPDAYITTTSDRSAAVSEGGTRGASYAGVRRLCTFASRFGRVLAHLGPATHPVMLNPGVVASGGEHGRGGFSVMHTAGSQGGVAFVFGDESGTLEHQRGSLLLADGSAIPIDLGRQSVGWYLFEVRLTGRAQLDYSNLWPLACLGRVLVLCGPEGLGGMISINGSPLEVEVTGGHTPQIIEHEGVLLIVCSDEQFDAVVVDGEAVLVGAAGLTPAGEVIPHPEHRHCLRITAEGVSSAVRTPTSPAAKAVAKKPRGNSRPHLGDWTAADTAEHVMGTSARYATIPAPADLSALGTPQGYGWYRVRLKNGDGRKHRVYFPGSGDRLHVMLDGEAAAVVGHGPGASPDCTIQLKKGPHTMVVLAEDLGRPSAGTMMQQPAGVVDHAWTVAPVRLEKPKIVSAAPVEPLTFRAPLWHVQQGDATDAARLTWTVQHRRRTPLFVHLPAIGVSGMVLLNNTPIYFLERASEASIVLGVEQLSRGNNLLQFTALGVTAAAAHDLTQGISVFEGTEPLTAKADWAFARWEMPEESAFAKARKPTGAGPVWWRTTMDGGGGTDPLYFDAAGLTKGQLYVNGRHLGRYFVATAAGKAVPPQARYYIPRPWLVEGENTLVVFDEHGAAPTRCRLVSGPDASPFVRGK